jgi:hypothetical protein
MISKDSKTRKGQRSISERIRQHSSPAMVVAVIALAFAMVGTAAATSVIGNGGAQSAKKKKAKRGPRGPKGPAGPQGLAGTNGVSGYVEVSTGSAYDSTSPKTAPHAQCPAGKKLMGGGVVITSDSDTTPVAVVESGPNTAGGTYWLGKGIETAATGESWNVQVTAYCANVN